MTEREEIEKNTWECDPFDHKWQWFKNWIDACEKKIGKDAPLTISSIKQMIVCCDKMEKTRDNIIIKSLE